MSDTPNDTSATDAPAAVVPVNPSKPKSLAVKPSMGVLASQTAPEELEAAVLMRRDALDTLAADPALSDNARAALQLLIKLASDQKPGMEEMQTAWKLARVYVTQPTTRSEAKPEAARPGDLYTSSGQLLERPWKVIPLYFFEENINFPDGGKNPVCSAPDGKLGSPFGKCTECPHLPFGKQPGGFDAQKKTDCQNNIVALVLSEDLSQLYLVQFGKTSRKAGGMMMQLAGQQQLVWKQSYVLTTEKKVNDAGLYYIYKVEPTGKNNSEDVCRIGEAFYGLYSAERKRMLADYYLRPARAPIAAAQAEGAFAGGALEAGLTANEGEEADLSTPVKKAGTSPSRNSSKPM